MLNETGFVDVELVSETGFNSSPVTKGVLFRARKSAILDVGRVEMQPKDELLETESISSVLRARSKPCPF